MAELNVENAVIHHFRSHGYKCLPDRSLKWRKFVIQEGKEWEPDVVAFKWQDNLLLDIRAVECKENGTYGGIMSAKEQVLTYQTHFPWCYIATEEPSNDLKAELSFLKKYHQIGYIPVRMGKGGGKVLEKELADYEVFPDYLNYELNETLSIITRQKLASFDIFSEMFGVDRVFFGFHGDYMWISTKEDVQYHIDNYNGERNFMFGLDIETQKSVKESLKGRIQKLQRILKDEEWQDHVVSSGLRVYSSLRPRIPMTTYFLQKYCKDLSHDDAVGLEKIMEKHEYQIIFLLRKIVWKREEILFKSEHFRRLDEERRRIGRLRRLMNW